MSDFELNLLRQRSLEAIRQKAKRGELQFCLPVGFCWAPTGKIEWAACAKYCFGFGGKRCVCPLLIVQETKSSGNFLCTTRSSTS
jgi:hypothetical protein